MARGLDKHRERQEAVANLGRQLARRSRSKCELCGENPGGLSPWEVPPVEEEPCLDETLLLCERCREGALGGDLDEREWRFLEEAIWSELEPAKVMAFKLLMKLEAAGAHWAQATMEYSEVPAEVMARLERMES